ncbi:MAG: ribbon-helix-helix domain-containing protein [Thermoproteota archaeon]
MKKEVKNIPQTVKKPKIKNVQIKIPDTLAREIDEVIRLSGRYESRLEFVREAVRQHIDRVRAVLEKEERAKAKVS